MVAGFEKVVHEGQQSNARCLKLDQALAVGQRHDGIFANIKFALLHRQFPELEDFNVPVADQAVTIHHTGCTPDQEDTYESLRTVIGSCSSDFAKRCGNCILNHVAGEDLLKSLKPFEPFYTGEVH